MDSPNTDPKYGFPRHTEQKFTPQPYFGPTKQPAPEVHKFRQTLGYLENSLNEKDIGKFKEFKFIHSGENYSKNPKEILNKLDKIKLSAVESAKGGELRDSKNILLELLAIFSTNYPHFVDEQTD